MRISAPLTFLTPGAVAVALLATTTFAPAQAQVDSVGFDGFRMDFVRILGGATADTRGFGSVADDYWIGVNEVSMEMIDAYNAANPGMAIEMYDYTVSGITGGNRPGRPAVDVSWNEAARFVNWTNVSFGSAPAYNFTTGGVNDDLVPWAPGDAGYNPANPFRNSDAVFFLPSEDEWYRAAYYDPTGDTYYDFATGSDTAPTPVSNGTAADTAVYDQAFYTGPADIKDAGGLSPQGTMAQTGNVFEWTESAATQPNDMGPEARAARGGSWRSPTVSASSSVRLSFPAADEANYIGFRIAAVPEPSGLLLMAIGSVGVLLRRRRQ